VQEIFEAVLAGAGVVDRMLRSTPASVHHRVTRDRLVRSIPHWLYIGDTALHLSAAALLPEVATTLLRAGADPNATNRRGAAPLHYACDARPLVAGWSPAAQIATIEVLVAKGAHVDHADRGGATPLHRAVRARSAEAVRALVALGARTDRRLRSRGSTPLHLAAASTGAGGTAGCLDEQLEIIDILRSTGADAEALDVFDRSPRDRARNERVAAALGVHAG
jgi:ankyrin repeat protein